jgi:hypothetical protein
MNTKKADSLQLWPRFDSCFYSVLTERCLLSPLQSISKAVEQYCRSIEALFLAEMFPRPSDFLQPQKSSAWIEKARQLAITGEKRVEPFNFLPQSCVKLNNVEAARKLLDKMYAQMEADKITDMLSKVAPPIPEKTEKDKFLFSVKVVIAEGLVPLDSSPSSKLDTFVTLSDEAGTRLAKTRTIYESLSPRCGFCFFFLIFLILIFLIFSCVGDETFDLSVDKPLWLMVSIRDRALVGKHDIVGRAYLCLDPRRFSDFLAHELWMDLDTQGRILVRVSMEGEKDDIQFFFGRGFRSLKRAEADMLRIFIDKVSSFFYYLGFSLNEILFFVVDVALYPTMSFEKCCQSSHQISRPRFRLQQSHRQCYSSLPLRLRFHHIL